MKYYIPFLFILSFPLLSQDKKVNVQILNQDIETTELEQKYNVSRKLETKKILPPKEDRDVLFFNYEAIKEWDEVKKDILYHDLKTKTKDEIIKKYPQINPKDISKLLGKIK